MKTYPHEFNVEVYEKTLTSRHYLPQCPNEGCFSRLMTLDENGWSCPRCARKIVFPKSYKERYERFKVMPEVEMFNTYIKMPSVEDFKTISKYMMATYVKTFAERDEAARKDILDRCTPFVKECFNRILRVMEEELKDKTLVDDFVETVNKNLFNDKNYRPYCGSNTCTLFSRAFFKDGKFQCHCGWKSPKTPKFLEAYIAHHEGRELPDVCYLSKLAEKLVEMFKPAKT